MKAKIGLAPCSLRSAHREAKLAALEEALSEQEEAVDALLKGAGEYLKALKAWKKACQFGHLNNRQKAATLAEKLAPALAEPAREAASSWEFDARAYFEGEDWRREIQAAAEKLGLRVLEENETLLSSPVVIRAQPGRSQLLLGKAGWPQTRPRLVAEELKRLRERTASANSQELLDSLFAAAERVRDPGDPTAKFRRDLRSVLRDARLEKRQPARRLRAGHLRPASLGHSGDPRRKIVRIRLSVREFQRARRISRRLRGREADPLLRHPVPIGGVMTQEGWSADRLRVPVTEWLHVLQTEYLESFIPRADRR